MQDERILKKDLFGEVWLLGNGEQRRVRRDTRNARWWLAWLARYLMRREAGALAALTGLDGVPQIQELDRYTLERSYLPGVPMFEGRPADAKYFRAASRLLRKLHTACVTHNDLAKEPNVLVRDDGSPAFIDFQLAAYSPRRGRLFRIAAREDIRHLLKHKRSYRPDLLTHRELAILAAPSLPSRLWMATVKPVYIFITRSVFGWSDREGAADRGRTD